LRGEEGGYGEFWFASLRFYLLGGYHMLD
jgi:hypothetical protein